MTKKLIAAIDLGTSSAKGAIYDRDARLLASARCPVQTHFPEPGWAEQAPRDWWSAIAAVMRDLVSGGDIDTADIAGLSFCSQMAGTVPVDETGQALCNALIWLDTRSAEIARRLTAGFPSVFGYGLRPIVHWLRETNGAPSLAGKDPTSKIVWLRENRPEIWARTYKVLDVKDYLVAKATGAFVTTPDCAHLTWMMNSRTNAWSDGLLRRLRIDRATLPEIVSGDTEVGGLTQDAAKALGLRVGTPVFAGLGDIAAFSLAAGSMADDAAHLYMGTSAWCGVHMARRKVDPLTSIATIRAADPDRYLLVAAQETAGACFEKVGSWLHMPDSKNDVPSLLREAGRSVPGARGVIFHPWFFGERVPMDNPHLRGSLSGLSLNHTSGDIARAAVEGVAFNLNLAHKALARLSSLHTDAPVRILGGCAQNDLICDVLANVLCRPVLRMQNPQLGGTFGAMASARKGLGLSQTWDDAAALSQLDRTFQPAPGGNAALCQAEKGFLEIYKRLKSWYRA